MNVKVILMAGPEDSHGFVSRTAPNNRRRRMRIGVACAIITTILISGSVFAYLYYEAKSPKRISALEAKRAADKIAVKENVTIPLCEICAFGSTTTGDVDEEGRSTLWDFVYLSSDDKNVTVEEIYISIYADGQTKYSRHVYGGYHRVYELVDFKIDSTAAYKTAIENPTVKKFRSEHWAEYFNGFGLTPDPQNNRNLWIVSWRDEGFMDDPVTCTAVIDATDGTLISPS
jgi:hypothetical protein